MAVVNTLAYYNGATIMGIRSFMVQALGLSLVTYMGVREGSLVRIKS